MRLPVYDAYFASCANAALSGRLHSNAREFLQQKAFLDYMSEADRLSRLAWRAHPDWDEDEEDAPLTLEPSDQGGAAAVNGESVSESSVSGQQYSEESSHDLEDSKAAGVVQVRSENDQHAPGFYRNSPMNLLLVSKLIHREASESFLRHTPIHFAFPWYGDIPGFARSWQHASPGEHVRSITFEYYHDDWDGVLTDADCAETPLTQLAAAFPALERHELRLKSYTPHCLYWVLGGHLSRFANLKELVIWDHDLHFRCMRWEPVFNSHCTLPVPVTLNGTRLTLMPDESVALTLNDERMLAVAGVLGTYSALADDADGEM
ncbi:hypothetical protein LTR53_017226 [Teratosphaeriaceae sp. CCFEE 6253]|nr:hypothetical protein LTR53_017226 [Teratosphaeriaceae sp. CCFEE 6253]